SPCLTVQQICSSEEEIGFDARGLVRRLKDGPRQVFEADAASFALAGSSATFKWTTSKGSIVEGQGTRRITVDTSGYHPGEKYAVTVSVGGLQRYCVNQLSSVATVGECSSLISVLGPSFLPPPGGRSARRGQPQPVATSTSVAEQANNT